MTKVWAGPSVGWAYLVSVIDCCTRDIVGWDFSLRCRTEEAIAALKRAVLEQMPYGSRRYGFDFDDRQRHAVYVRPLSWKLSLGSASPIGERFQPSRGQWQDRELPSQPERRGDLAQRVPNSGRAKQSSPVGSKSTITTARTARSTDELHTKPVRGSPNPYFKHGPLCLVLGGCTTQRLLYSSGVSRHYLCSI